MEQKKILLSVLASLAIITSCQTVNQSTVSQSPKIEVINNYIDTNIIRGKVDFPVSVFSNRSSETGKIPFVNPPSSPLPSQFLPFTLQATLGEIATQSTVSLLYPSEHPVSPNVTIATGLTNASGNFTINPGFTPTLNAVYVLEAVKRIGDAGNDNIALRTYVKWNGNGWKSMTSPGIFINTKTTALSIIQNYNKNTVSAADTVDKIDVSGENSVPLDIGSPVLISAQTVLDVSSLVTYVLNYNYDPMYYIRPVDGKYKIILNYPVIPPEPPESLNTTSITGLKFTVNWSSVPNSTYDLVVKRVSDGAEIFNSNVNNATTYNITGLARATEYSWKVRSKSTIYNLPGNFSSEQIVTTLATDFALSPSNLTTTSFTANWDAVQNATGYKLYVDGVQYPDNSTVITGTTYNVTGVDSDTHSYYVVALINQSNPLTSNTVSFSNALVTWIMGFANPPYNWDGLGSNANLYFPRGIVADAPGNLYVADTNSSKIKKIAPEPSWRYSTYTFAGGNYGAYYDGTGSNAFFNNPEGIAADSSGNLYVADTKNNRIRKITSSGVVTTFAGSTSGYLDQTGTNAQFNQPKGIAVDSSGNLYIADTDNNRIRKITSSGTVTTLAGSTSGYLDQTGTNAQFNQPKGITVDSSGNLYISDTGNNRIRKIDTNGVVTTFAGSTQGSIDGTGTNAQFNHPNGIVINSSDNVYVADTGNSRIRKITPLGIVSTLAGNTTNSEWFWQKFGTEAWFNMPEGLAIDSSGVLYVSNTGSHSIWKIE